ncbi:MAG: ABC transporter transmembrane domain-containing protein [Planctomycetota bacterium]
MSGYVEDKEYVASRAWDHRLFQRLPQYARPHWKLFLASFGVLVACFACELAGPYIWRAAIDGPVSTALAAAPDADKSPLVHAMLRWIGLYLGVVCALGVLRYFQVAVLNRTGQVVIHDLRTQIFAHIQRLDLAFFDRRPVGSLVTRVTTDIENLAELFASGVVTLAFDTLRVAVLVVLLFFIHAKLALVVLLLLPVLVGISLAFRGGARQAHRSVRARLSAMNGYLQEVLSGVRVVQMFHREDRVSKTFAEHLHGYYLANKRTIFLFALFFPAMTLGTFLIEGAALKVGVESLVGGGLTAGDFILFWMFLVMVVNPIRELGSATTCCNRRLPRPNASSTCSTPNPRCRSPPDPRRSLRKAPAAPRPTSPSRAYASPTKPATRCCTASTSRSRRVTRSPSSAPRVRANRP